LVIVVRGSAACGRLFGRGVDVYLENDWEESEKIGLRDLKRLGRGAREGGSDVGNLGLRRIQLQTITSPAGDPDFDNTGGTMPLNRSRM